MNAGFLAHKAWWKSTSGQQTVVLASNVAGACIDPGRAVMKANASNFMMTRQSHAKNITPWKQTANANDTTPTP